MVLRLRDQVGGVLRGDDVIELAGHGPSGDRR
jgi:hypothetical protein